MTSEKFRHQLRQEAQKWQEEGLINAELYERLSQRYRFQALTVASRNRFVAIFLVLGSLLLGLAVITLIAANWQAWPRTVKAGMLMTLFIGVNWGGFHLWHYSQESWQSRLGKGLLLLGGLLLGANLGLMSQMFHRSDPVFHLFLVWGLGVWLMAYSLRLTLLGVLATVLLAWGYGAGITTQVVLANPTGWRLTIAHFPILACLLLLPLAYRCRSKWLFGMSAMVVVIALELNLPIFLRDAYLDSTLSGWIVAIAAILPTAWLWAYDDQSEDLIFRPIARNLSLFLLSLLLFFLSFNFWADLPTLTPSEVSSVWQQDWQVLWDLLLLMGWAMWGWWQLGKSANDSAWRLDSNSYGIAGILLTAGGCIGWQLSLGAIGAWGTVLFNVLLFCLAIGLLRQALSRGQRLGFWGGVVLLGVQLTARMLEYDTGLLLKAIALFCCGVAVILAGLWFERYLRAEKFSKF